MGANRGEKLAGNEVERDVRLAVGVQKDRVIPGVAGLEPWPSIGGVEMQARTVQVKQPLPDRGQLAVELHCVNPGGRIEVSVGAGYRAGGVAQDRDAPGRGR